MITELRAAVAASVIAGAVLVAAQPSPIDTATIGPQVGAVVPAVAGVDQAGTPRTLASIAGPKGAMLVFFRSADW